MVYLLSVEHQSGVIPNLSPQGESFLFIHLKVTPYHYKKKDHVTNEGKTVKRSNGVGLLGTGIRRRNVVMNATPQQGRSFQSPDPKQGVT